MYKKKVLIYIIIIMFLGAGGVGIIKKLQTPGSESVKITVVQPEQCPDMMPHYLALKNGFFKEFLATVNVKTYDGNEKPTEALARGQADIIVMDLAEFLFARYNNADLIAVGAVTAAKPSYIMAREEMPGFSWIDMQHKTVIGDPPESTAGILLEIELRRNEMKPFRQVSIYYNIPQDLKKGAFKSETGNFMQASEPIVSELELEGTARVVASLASNRIPAYVYVTSSKMLKEKPEKYHRFFNGLHKTLLWMDHHPDLILKEATAQFSHIDKLVLERAVNRFLEEKVWPQTPILNDTSIRQFHDMMIVSGELPAPIDYINALENKFSQQAVDTVKYIPPEEQKKGLKQFWPF